MRAITTFGAACALLLPILALAGTQAEAGPRRHKHGGGYSHHGGGPSRPHGQHGGGHLQIGHGPMFPAPRVDHGHRGHHHGPWDHSGRPGYHVYAPPPAVYVGGPAVYVSGGYPAPGCSTARNVTYLPNGWRKIVTTRTCYAP